MNMFKRSTLLVIILILAGCASTYTPTGKMIQLKQGMDKQAAVIIFNKYAKPSNVVTGFCVESNLMFDSGTPLTITPDGYTFRAYKAGDIVSKEKIDVSTTKYTYKKIYYQASRSFSNVTKIRVQQIEPILLNCTVVSKSGYSIRLHFGSTESDSINVNDAGLDEMMAALTILAPQAELIKGIGL
jgi:hypothetical protein